MKKQKGFTLIELFIVIAFGVIILSVVIPPAKKLLGFGGSEVSSEVYAAPAAANAVVKCQPGEKFDARGNACPVTQ
jgi:prepilin-type N-terminal cleavage/methylation domain-containing protein